MKMLNVLKATLLLASVAGMSSSVIADPITGLVQGTAHVAGGVVHGTEYVAGGVVRGTGAVIKGTGHAIGAVANGTADGRAVRHHVGDRHRAR